MTKSSVVRMKLKKVLSPKVRKYDHHTYTGNKEEDAEYVQH